MDSCILHIWNAPGGEDDSRNPWNSESEVVEKVLDAVETAEAATAPYCP